MKIARISKGIFGKSQCNTEMSTVIPINLKRGVKFILKRNDLGLLMSRFYGPMACFAVLAMLSYNINIDVVNISFYLRSSKKEKKSINDFNLFKTSTGARTNGHDYNIVLDFIQRL